MNAFNRIQGAVQNYLNSPFGFSVATTFTTPAITTSPNYVTPAVSVTVNAMPIKHAFEIVGINSAGLFTRSTTIRVTVVEAILIAAGFPTRNATKESKLKDCLVSFTDTNGNPVSGTITEVRPDDSVGLLVCQVRVTI